MGSSSASLYKDPSLSLTEQYRMRQGIRLQASSRVKTPPLPGGFGQQTLSLEGYYALHSMQKAAAMSRSTSGPTAAMLAMDAFCERLQCDDPAITCGEAQRLLAQLARCLNDVVA